MKFFDYDTIMFGTADEVEECKSNYDSFRVAHRHLMTPGIRKLSSEINFHDAIILWADNDQSQDTMVVEYIIGDLKVGYQSCIVSYGGIIRETSLFRSFEQAVNDRRSEVIASEIINTEGGYWLHSLLTDPKNEACILFRDVSVRLEECERPSYKSFGHPFSVRFDSDG